MPESNPTKRRPRRRNFGTQTEAACALRVSAQMFSRWVAMHDWPFGRRGPFDVRAIIAWRVVLRGWELEDEDPRPDLEAFKRAMRAAGLEDQIEAPERRRAAPDGDTSDWWDVRLKELRCIKLEHQIERDKGLYIARETSDAAVVAVALYLRQKVEEWVEQMADLFANRDRSAIHRLARAHWDALCRDLEHATAVKMATVEEVERIRSMRDPNKVHAAAVRRDAPPK